MWVMFMTLDEIYGVESEEWSMNMDDLHHAVNVISGWLDGGEVDPDLASYMGMMLISISRRAPKLSNTVDH